MPLAGYQYGASVPSNSLQVVARLRERSIVLGLSCILKLALNTYPQVSILEITAIIFDNIRTTKLKVMTVIEVINKIT